MNEKIRVVVDYTTPTRERRPTTIEDIYDDFKVLEFNSKEELADELARMNGYENLEEFKQELIDGGDDLDDYDFEGDELDKICQYFLSSMTDPGDGSPNIQYISINDKPAYEDYWMIYDSLSDNMELLARGSEEDIVKYFLKYEYDYVEDEDDSEDDEELEESFKSMDKKGLYEAVKDIKEDVETVYKVISVIFPDEEEIEEFGSKEDAMEYAQEQISSEDYNEVIVSEVTIDEDGYEDETILLDEQSESKSNAYYALHTFYEDEPDEIDIDSLEVFESEEEAMKRAKELEAKGLRVVINIEGDESAGWDSEEYEYSDIGDEIYSTPYIMEEDVKSTKKMRTEQDWEDELKNNASRTSQIIKKLQDILNREKPPYYPYPGNIKTYIDQIHYYFLKGDENEVNSWLNDAEKYIISKMEDAIKQRSMGIKIKDSDFDYGDDEDEDFEYPDSSERYFFRVYFHDENQEELFAVDDGGYDFEPSYDTAEEALEAMKKILKDPKVQADPEIAGCHSVFVPDTEDVREVEEETGYEEFEVVDWIDKENLKESFKSKDKYSVLREALDRLDREDNKGKKIKARAQIRNLRSKLKQ